MGHATCFQQHLSGEIKMASYKDYKTVAAAKKAGSMYFIGKDGKKKLAVTAEQLKAWKKKNKGKFKGSALTAWANAKGKNLGGAVTTSLRPKKRPSSDVSKNASQPKITVAELRSPLDRDKRDPDTSGRNSKSLEEVIKIAEEALADALKNRTRYDVTDIAKKREELRDLKKKKDKRLTKTSNAMKFGKTAVKKAPTSNTSGKPRSSSGLAKGGMMKKKGYAKGGVAKKSKK